jgi:hypothetical protein
MEEKKSKFSLALEGIVSKAKEATTNFYLSQNPSTPMYGDEHIEALNEKLYKHGYRVVSNELQGDWIEYGYQVQSFVHKVPVTGLANRIESAIDGDKRKTIFFSESSKALDDWLEKNLATQLGWKAQYPVEALTVIKQAPSLTASKIKALQPTMTM